MTEDDLMALPDDAMRHELVAGFIVAEPLPSHRHDRTRRRLERLLEVFVAAQDLGEVFGEAGYLLARNPDTVRGPDLSFVIRERLAGFDDARFFRGAPDLAVEILSPSNRPGEIRAKVADYIRGGSRLVWVVDPERKAVTVYQPSGEPRRLVSPAALSGEGVLPDLSIPLASIFDK